MKKNNLKILVGIFFICIVLVSAFSTNLQAAINEIYGTPEEVSDENLDEKAKESGLLEWIIRAFYYVASWVEDNIGLMFQGLTGTNEFPWADRVIFNAVPFLDVNFLNPEPGSLFLAGSGQKTALASVIVKIYGSLITLAIGFLGVAVGIISIKLAISTVASQKAQYKKSLVKFCTSIVLLFCVHYIIALVFYVNEKLVETASAILTDTVSELGLQNNLDLSNKLNKDTLVTLYLQANTPEKDKDFNSDEICAFTLIEPFSTSFDKVLKGSNNLKLEDLPFKNVSEASTYIKNNSEIAASLIREFKDNRYSMAYSTSKEGTGFFNKLFRSGEVSENRKYAIGLLAFDIWISKGGKKDEKSSISPGVKNYIDNEVKPYLKIFANNTDEKIANEYVNVIKNNFIPNVTKMTDNVGIEYSAINASDDNFVETSYSGYLSYANLLKQTKFVFVSQSLINGGYYIGNTIVYNQLFGFEGLGDMLVYESGEMDDILDTDWYGNDFGPTFLVSASGKNLTDGTDNVNNEIVVIIDSFGKKYPFTVDVDVIKRFVTKWRNSTKTKYYEKILNMYSHYALTPDDKDYMQTSNDNVFSVITSLANYFKDAVWGYEVNSNGELIGWRQNNFTVSGAIIYCVFLIQSLMFFIAYIKRFFYVTILAMFAPVVVLYNFMFGGV